MNRIILSLILLFGILKIDAQEYFPNNELSEVMELLENFNTHLDENYKL